VCRDVLASQRDVVGVPGFVNAGNALAWLLTCRGRYAEARALLDEVIPDARRIGGPELLSRVLVVEAELEEGRGNMAAAQQAAAAAVDVVTEDFSAVYAGQVVPVAVRLLAADRASALVDLLRPYAAHPAFEARVAEADGVLRGDVASSARAADLHASFGAVCDEARCRLEAGQLDRARQLIEGHGLEAGPLGKMQNERTGARTP
jgi:ATP/maltotriose-dependent transcriptional regulator MalT